MAGEQELTFALHGNLGAADDWLAEDFFCGRCEALDLWDEVRSGLGLKDWGEDFSRRVSERADGEDAKPWLAGYSLGGRLALHALIAAPNQWAGAIIVSAHPGLESDDERKQRSQRDAEWAERARTGEWVNFLAEWNSQPVFGGDPDQRILTRQGALQGQREEIALAFEHWSTGRQQDLRPALSRCDLPVLWVSGGDDARFSGVGREMVDVMPQCEHRVVEGCGHRVLDQSPAELAAAISTLR